MAEKLSADELEKLAGAATARPWYALEEIAEYEGFEISSPAQHCISTYEDDTCDAVAWMGPGGGGDEKENAANADFIAYLANHATAIADVVRENEKFRDALTSIAEYWNGSENNSAMSDALGYIVSTAREALGETK